MPRSTLQLDRLDPLSSEVTLLVPKRAANGPPGAGHRTGPEMLGSSSALRRVLRQLERFAPVRAPVLIRGESGTGKELAAAALHAAAHRRGAPLIPINCAAVPLSLAESQLFGHRQGAFTGATRNAPGAFVRADGGTLFLDEVGELPLAAQAKLLRVLETKSVVPVGGERERTVNVRIVAATHRPLERMVERGNFREDLYHRISALTVTMPPLRERAGDIPALLEHFRELTQRDAPHRLRFSPAAVQAAMRYRWPGNVRELRNAVLRAAALCDGHEIDAALLIPPNSPPRACDGDAAQGYTVAPGSYAAMRRSLCRQVIAEAGSLRKAATALGIPRSTLSDWIRSDA